MSDNRTVLGKCAFWQVSTMIKQVETFQNYVIHSLSTLKHDYVLCELKREPFQNLS